MARTKALVFILFFAFSAALLMGFGGKETAPKGTAGAGNEEAEPGYYRDRNKTAEDPAIGPVEEELGVVRVSGRVRLVGSSPRTELVISGDTEDWFTEQQDRDKLAQLQQQTVTVEGSGYSRDMILANGIRMGKRLILRNIRVIEPPPR
ncbi:MAG: hypothetical protein LBT16_05785 [Treponema sp.]|jgi:hypothetical protein|nr:hypothetical protein [Treponema sp.]